MTRLSQNLHDLKKNVSELPVKKLLNSSTTEQESTLCWFVFLTEMHPGSCSGHLTYIFNFSLKEPDIFWHSSSSFGPMHQSSVSSICKSFDIIVGEINGTFFTSKNERQKQDTLDQWRGWRLVPPHSPKLDCPDPNSWHKPILQISYEHYFPHLPTRALAAEWKKRSGFPAPQMMLQSVSSLINHRCYPLYKLWINPLW